MHATSRPEEAGQRERPARWTLRPPEAAPPLSALLEQGRVRLMTLVGLRWLAIAGQTTAVLIVHVGLGFRLPMLLAFSVIATSVLLNVIVTLRYPPSRRLSDGEAAGYLAFDVLELTALLMLTGGLHNPFALLFVAPATISATSLSLRSTLLIAGLTLGCIVLIALVAMPLPWYADEAFALPGMYLVGQAVALVLGLGFTAGYVWRISAEAHAMSNALAATQLVLAREQKLSALGGLAAAAAHELGTPLGTIATAAKELSRSLPAEGEEAEDLSLIREQTQRCREILSRLARHSETEDAHYSRLSLGSLLDEVADPHRDFDVPIEVRMLAGEGAGPEPDVWRRPEILYGLGNIVENAVDFARGHVRISARWDPSEVEIVVRDDGPGFSQDILDRLGEPYVSTRPRVDDGARAPGADEPEGHQGMGLGFFIARTLLERTGGAVSFGNAAAEDGMGEGARVVVRWKREAVVAAAG
ncbi:MAG: ActS/PrrB/RegB family redox-sensitive histidine kinase [Alphaproteobacteria bacterium]|nr:ActS/PrrB/RegB family redox-sensitive histidine kinase [Alphaproteobacteria bacterium]